MISSNSNSFLFASTVSVKLMNCDELNNIAPIIFSKSEPYTDIPSCNIITCDSASLSYDFEICDIIEIDTNISSNIIMVVLKFLIHTYFYFELSFKIYGMKIKYGVLSVQRWYMCVWQLLNRLE